MNFRSLNFTNNPIYKHMELNKLLSLDTTTEVTHLSDPFSSSIVVTPDRVHLNRHIKNYIYRDVNIIRDGAMSPYMYLFQQQNTIGDEALLSRIHGIVINNKKNFKDYSISYIHPEKNYSYQSAIPLYIEISPYSKVVLHELFFNDAVAKIFKFVYVLREGASLIVNRSYSTRGILAQQERNEKFQAHVVESSIIQHPGSTLKFITNSEKNNYLQDLYFLTAHEETSTEIVGRYYSTKNDSVHVITDINHIAPNSTSNVDVKCVADENSRFTFAGNINVSKEATGVDANLQNKNLQLSDKSVIITEPKLDIKTKEIACKHGCTVSSIDPDKMYLLNTKGIDANTAKRILKESFLSYSREHV